MQEVGISGSDPLQEAVGIPGVGITDEGRYPKGVGINTHNDTYPLSTGTVICFLVFFLLLFSDVKQTECWWYKYKRSETKNCVLIHEASTDDDQTFSSNSQNIIYKKVINKGMFF